MTGAPDRPLTAAGQALFASACRLLRLDETPGVRSVPGYGYAPEIRSPASSSWDRAAANGLTPDALTRHVQSTTRAPCRLLETDLAAESAYFIGLIADGYPVGVFSRFAGHGYSACDLHDLVRMEDFGELRAADNPARLVRLLDAMDMFAGISGSFLAAVRTASHRDWVWSGDANYVCACLTVGETAGLTDTQTVRWTVRWTDTAEKVIPSGLRGQLGKWLASTGPDGWMWAAAGYTPEQMAVLVTLPLGHPDRPTDDQLTVMAALRAGR